MLLGAWLGVRGRAVAGHSSWLLSGSLADARAVARTGRLCAMLRWLTAGESHGPLLTAILEGLPAHVR